MWAVIAIVLMVFIALWVLMVKACVKWEARCERRWIAEMREVCSPEELAVMLMHYEIWCARSSKINTVFHRMINREIERQDRRESARRQAS